MDPILTSIAAALAKEAATAAKPACAALVKFVKGKFAGSRSSEMILAAAQRNPEQSTELLAQVLDEAEQADPEFKRELRSLWDTARVEINASHNEQTASHGGVNNSVTGNVHGSVIQGRDFTGGITLR